MSNTNNIVPIISVYLFLVMSCANADNTLYSRNYSNSKKISMLHNTIDVKSPIEWTEFKLFDVNKNNRSIPGSSYKDYKIVIKMDPKYIKLWLQDKDLWITSFPHNIDWIKETLKNEQLSELQDLGYMTYYKEESGYKYTLWANNEKGVILISFLQN